MKTYRNSQGVEISTPCIITAPDWELVQPEATAPEPAQPQEEAEQEKKPNRRRKTGKE